MYPRLEISLEGIENNAKIINDICKEKGVILTGVVKSSNSFEESYVPVAQAMTRAGILSLGDSRLRTLIQMRKRGFEGHLMMIRIPMQSELKQLVYYADSSLHSERETLIKLNEEAKKQGKTHGVLLMVDLGDLREGIEDEEELFETALLVENELTSLELLGIGTNLVCYGGVIPDEDNMTRLVALAEHIEEKIDRTLQLISGGASPNMTMLLEDELPERINHLRMGELILLAKDMVESRNMPLEGMSYDNYILKAEVIEIKTKHSHPQGQIYLDAFGKMPTFEDRGRRKRALVALGQRDVGDINGLTPLMEGIEIMGASSDHGILDIEDAKEEIKLGDIISFRTDYQTMMHSIESASVYIGYR